MGKQLNPYRKSYKELSKDLSPEDTSATLDMICTCLRNTGGRPATYPNNESGLNAFIENTKGYFSYLQSANSKLDDSQKLIPDVEGLSLYCGVDRRTIERYRERGGAWTEIIDYTKNAIAYCKKQLALRGKIPTVMAIFDLSNNHNYINASEFKMVREDAAHIEKKDLESQLMDAGLVWDPERGEFISMSQEGDNHVDT